jgi:hypothetical protein
MTTIELVTYGTKVENLIKLHSKSTISYTEVDDTHEVEWAYTKEFLGIEHECINSQ